MRDSTGARPSFFGAFIQVTFWLVLFSSSVVFCLYILPWREALYRSALIISCHAFNFYAFYFFIVPYWFKRRKYLEGFVVSAVFVAVLTPLRLQIANLFVLSEILVINIDFAGRIAFIIFTEVTIAAFASFMRLAADHDAAQRKLIALESLHLDSELRFLKAQMSPHFLFNTINNIYSLTLTRSDKAPESLMRLSALLRYLLYESSGKVVLVKEISALRSYADLFSLKYERPLNLTIVARAGDAILVEPLILLPILENAVKHSGIGISADAFVRFTISEDKHHLTIECENSKCNQPIENDSGGIGLPNIRKRLEMVYGRNFDLTISEDERVFYLFLKMTIQ